MAIETAFDFSKCLKSNSKYLRNNNLAQLKGFKIFKRSFNKDRSVLEFILGKPKLRTEREVLKILLNYNLVINEDSAKKLLTEIADNKNKPLLTGKKYHFDIDEFSLETLKSKSGEINYKIASYGRDFTL